MSRKNISILGIVSLSLVAALCIAKPSELAEITVNANVTHQTMSGWEATAQVGYPDFPDWDIYKNKLMDMVAADGINRLRLEITINDESTGLNSPPINDNADPFTINWSGFHFGNNSSLLGTKKIEIANMLRSRLAARGEPMPFTILCYVDFASRQGFSFYHHDNPEEYAELIEAAFLTIHKEAGWVPDAVEIILEPDNGWNELWNPPKVANCLLATQRRLANHGWYPRFIIPAVTNCPNGANWYNKIKRANPAVLLYVDELAYHRYGKCTDSALATNKAAAEADGNRLSMTEFIKATYEDLHKDLKANAVAWQQYAIAYDNVDNGTQYYNINHATHAITVSSRMKFLRQYFKYVRRGAVRIEAASNNPNFDPIAFRNTNGKQVVVVKSSSGGSLNIQGLPAGTYGIKYTTKSQYDVDTSPVTINAGQVVTTSIPEAGVITVFGTSVASSEPTPASAMTPSEGEVDREAPALGRPRRVVRPKSSPVNP